MALPAIINNQKSFGASFGEKLGENLGSGLSSGLQQLANQKLEKMQKKNAIHELRQAIPDLPDEALPFLASRPAKELNQLLEHYGNQRRQQEEQQLMEQQQQQQMAQQQQEEIPDEHFTPEVFQHIQEQLQNPEVQQQLGPEQFQKIQNNLAQMQQRLGNNPVGQNPFPKEQPAAAQQAQPAVAPSKGGIPLTAFGKGSPSDLAREKQDLAREKFEFEKQQAKEKMTAAIQESEDTPAQKKYKEEVSSAYSLYDDLLETSKRMLKNSQENDVSTGFISNLQYGIDPTTLDDATEAFAKDSDHIVNLTSTGLKGVMSKYRVQKLEAEKPSLRHGKKVNEDILRTYIEKAEHKLKQIEKENPKVKFERISDVAQDEQELALAQPLEYPQFFDENTRFDPEDGSGKIYILKNGVWEEE